MVIFHILERVEPLRENRSSAPSASIEPIVAGRIPHDLFGHAGPEQASLLPERVDHCFDIVGWFHLCVTCLEVWRSGPCLSPSTVAATMSPSLADLGKERPRDPGRQGPRLTAVACDQFGKRSAGSLHCVGTGMRASMFPWDVTGTPVTTCPRRRSAPQTPPGRIIGCPGSHLGSGLLEPNRNTLRGSRGRGRWR